MTSDEVKARAEEFVKIIPEDHTSFILIILPGEEKAFLTGFGCRACIVEAIIEQYLAGAFQHNYKDIHQ
jgi:hypothetical protein